MLCCWGGAQKAGRDHSQGQLTPNGQRDIPAHRMSCSVWAELAGSHRSLLRMGWPLLSGCWAVVMCITHHSCILFLSFPFHYYKLLLQYFASIQLQNCPYPNPRGLLSNSPPQQGQGKVSEGLCGAWVPAGVKPWQCPEGIFHQQNTKNIYLVKKPPSLPTKTDSKPGYFSEFLDFKITFGFQIWDCEMYM